MKGKQRTSARRSWIYAGAPPAQARLHPSLPRIPTCHPLLMFGDPDPFSDLFPTFFNPPTIVVSTPDVLSGLTAGIQFPTSSTQPPQTTQTSSTSTSHQITPLVPSRPPVRTPSTSVRTSTHSPISLPSSTPSSTVDATTVIFNVTNVLTETSLLTASESPSASASAASLHSDVRTLPRGVIAGIVVAILSGAAVVCLAVLLLYRRRRTKQRQERAILHRSSPLLFRCAGTQSPQPLRGSKAPSTRAPDPSQTEESAATPTRPRESVVVDMSYISDDHLPLMRAGTSSPWMPRRVTRRERDGGLVPPSLYLDTSCEQYAAQSVEYLPPAYEDLPPSPLSPITTTPMTHG
ncbi:hypothetical protein C8T65DRAFT_659713 [Cerioporus squamosus]|nr:hypothetical protein C8T65DRAFT_659713 [Cerioporus squamosus]